jgi:hypothetical protein
MTWSAVIVVPLVVPSTKACSPLARSLAEVALPFVWNTVVGTSLTVTFWPPDVVKVKLDVDSALTVPTAPPDAGPDRALPAPRAGPAAVLGAVTVDAGVAGPEDEATATETPVAVIAAATAAAAQRPRLLAIMRRYVGRSAGGSLLAIAELLSWLSKSRLLADFVGALSTGWSVNKSFPSGGLGAHSRNAG